MDYYPLTLVLYLTPIFLWFVVVELIRDVTASLALLIPRRKQNLIVLVSVSTKQVHNNLLRIYFTPYLCIVFFTVGTLVSCEPKVMVDAYSADIAVAIKQKAKTCPKDCISDDYHISASTADLYVGDYDDMNMRDIGLHDDSMVYSAIHFFYPSFSYTIIKNHPQSIVKWLSKNNFLSFEIN